MTVTRQSLVEHFRLLSDEELLAQFQSGELTDMAKEVAGSELRGRKIDCSEPAAENLLSDTSAESEAAVDTGDLELAARYATAAEAYMLQGRLEQEGVPAIVADALTAQNLVPLATGGVRVLVPEAYLSRAREIARRSRGATSPWMASARKKAPEICVRGPANRPLPVRMGYSGSMPAARMTSVQRVTSALIQAVASSGVPPTGS
jgi:hypothetical protein